MVSDLKRLFHYTNKEGGFFFPYVIFITGVVLLIISSSIYIYRQEIAITEKHLDQYKIETLYQMGVVQIKEQWKDEVQLGMKEKYVYPDGDIELKVLELTDEGYIVNGTVSTDESTYNKNIYVKYDENLNEND